MNGCSLVSEEIALMVHAFGDEGRRQAVRDLAARVQRLEVRVAELVAFVTRVAEGEHPDEMAEEAMALLSNGGDK